MIICVNLEPKSKDDLDRLVALGGYRDYSEAVAVAISNQLLLHTVESSTSFQVTSLPPLIREASSKPTESELERQTSALVPTLFGAITEDHSAVKIAQATHDQSSSGDGTSLDKWIWGQHNKLLPVKAACRALAHLLTRELASYEGVSLSKASSEIAFEAVKLGDHLRLKEREFGLLRDETLAHGFPRRDAENEDKSRLRFATQFVGSTDSQGNLTGLPADLKLIGIESPRGTRILLTEAGWRFAAMENPILDAPSTRPARKFTEEEVGFLFDHIMEQVPCESFAFRTVVKLIDGGACTPELLDQALRDYLPDRNENPFSPAFLTTQRAGVISRLSDLGLLQRVRDGIKVRYAMTDDGQKYFQTVMHRTA